MQMQSDISGIDVVRFENPEATATGAAYLAGLAVGLWKSRDELKGKLGREAVFSPSENESERKIKKDGWKRAVKACRAFTE